MKKTHYIFLILFGFNFSFGAEDNPALKHNGFSLTSIEKQIHYTNPGYELQQTIHNGVSYTKPEIIGGGSIAEPGQPSLPTVTTFYAVEPGKTFSVQAVIEQTQTHENIDLLPFDSWENESDGIVEEGSVYQQNQLFPENIASVSEPIIFRDIAMVQVSITPFQYNPVTKTLVAIQDMEIELIENGVTQDTPFIPQKRSREFETLYESLIVNYNSLIEIILSIKDQLSYMSCQTILVIFLEPLSS